MRTNRISLVLLLAASLLAWTFARGAPAVTPARPLGGGAVMNVQTKVLEALDRGDFSAAAASFGKRRKPAFVMDRSIHGGGHAQGRSAVQRALAAWYADAKGSVETRIVEQRVECGHQDLSYGTFRIERRVVAAGASPSEARIEVFDVTTLLSLRGSPSIFHMHVSRAGDVER